jgi:hypothetical protein
MMHIASPASDKVQWERGDEKIGPADRGVRGVVVESRVGARGDSSARLSTADKIDYERMRRESISFTQMLLDLSRVPVKELR